MGCHGCEADIFFFLIKIYREVFLLKLWNAEWCFISCRTYRGLFNELTCILNDKSMVNRFNVQNDDFIKSTKVWGVEFLLIISELMKVIRTLSISAFLVLNLILLIYFVLFTDFVLWIVAVFCCKLQSVELVFCFDLYLNRSLKG